MEFALQIFQVKGPLLSLLSDDSPRTRMFILKSLTIIFTSQSPEIPIEFLTKAIEVSDRLDDEHQENREEAVRTLGALLHFIASRENQVEHPLELTITYQILLQDENQKKSVDDFYRKVISKLVLHMDDESEIFRNIVLGCVITLPSSLDPMVREAVEKVRGKHLHWEQVEKIVEKIGGLSV